MSDIDWSQLSQDPNFHHYVDKKDLDEMSMYEWYLCNGYRTMPHYPGYIINGIGTVRNKYGRLITTIEHGSVKIRVHEKQKFVPRLKLLYDAFPELGPKKLRNGIYRYQSRIWTPVPEYPNYWISTDGCLLRSDRYAWIHPSSDRITLYNKEKRKSWKIKKLHKSIYGDAYELSERSR